MPVAIRGFQKGYTPWNKIPVDIAQLKLLYIGEGLSLSETASNLGVSSSTVYARLLEAAIERHKRGNPKGVNRSPDRSYMRTPEYRIMQSLAQKERKFNKERGRNISLAKSGKLLSEEHKKALSIAHIGIQKGEKHPSYGKPRSPETKAKIRAKVSGDKHPNWKGGLPRKYAKEFNKELRELIRQRDNYTCQLCGVPQNECIYPLGIHHKDYNKMNSLPSNLITLCNKCNGKVNFNREFWIEYFRKEELLCVQ